MATIRAFTTIEQSRKLAEILPIESADMYYPWDIDSKSFLNIPIVKDASYYLQGSIDCWSLSSLLGVLPKGYSLGRRTNGKYYVCMTCVKHDVVEYDNPIDACVAMIEKLNELNLL